MRGPLRVPAKFILAPKVLVRLRDYWGRYKSGEMKTFEQRKAA